MLKKAFFIVVPIVVVIVLIFLFGINTYNSKYEVFQSDGHIIAKNSGSTTEKVFFDTETKYKTVDDNVYITTKDNGNIIIPAESFIHYTDGSISTFSKAVVLDLDDLNKEIFKYYNIFPETIFVKNSNMYSINYLDKKLNFTNFLLKISNDKYMIIGQKMTLKIGGVEKTFDNNYLEISYLDGNVIKIENQSVAYQSVDDEVLLEIGDGTVIDLALRNIYKGKERKLAMGEITIDSDDNIQINADDNKSITGDNVSEDGEGGNGSSGGSGGSSDGDDSRTKLPDVNSGVVDTTVNTIEQIIDENARIKDPEFKIIDMEVTANRLRASVQIVDEAAVLMGSVNIKIIEYDTNKVVFETNDDSGSNIIDIEDEVLVPETNYILVINSDYKKNNVNYNKDFVQKTFITDAVGVELKKYFISETEIQVNVKSASYSDVISVDLTLMDDNGSVLKVVNVPLTDEDNVVSFTGLVHNTSYKIKASNFIYKDSIISDGFIINKTFKTLKVKPSIGTTSFVIDKKEGKFNFMINNNSDPDGGIGTYRYEVYDARTINNPDIAPVSVIEKKNNASASLSVDGKTIERGVPYIFRTVMVFDDNEKEYEYISEYSDVMKLDGVQFPTIRFIKDTVTFERIKGVIEITDDGNTLDINNGNVITITYTDSVGNSKTFTASGSLKIPVDVNNLRSNETYSFALSSRVDLQDGNPAIDQCYIGSVVIKTVDPDPFSVEFSSTENASAAFSVVTRIVPSRNHDTELEADTLTGISFNLYTGASTKGTLVKTIKSVDKDLEAYSSELRGKYYDDTFVLNPSFFGMNNSDFKSEYYTIEITNAYDYTVHKNDLPIENNVYTVKIKEAYDLPPNINDAVDIIPIRNRDLEVSKRRSDLEDSTIVGYKFRGNYDNAKKSALKIHYFLYDMEGNILKTVDYVVPPTGDIDYSSMFLKDGLLPGVTDGDFHRGQTFYITYTVDIDRNYDGVVDELYPPGDVVLKSRNISPPRQKPYFQLYPSTSDSTSYVWKYQYSDIDHALFENKLYSYIDGVETEEKVTTQSEEFQTVSFAVNGACTFSVYAKYQEVDGKDPKREMLSNQYYEGITSLDFGKVALYDDKNRVIFSFVDYEDKLELFDKVSAVKIDFVTSDKVVTIDGLSINGGNITINYSSIESLQGKVITPRITVYYDSGAYGFDNSGDAFAIQKVRNDVDDIGHYYTFGSNSFSTHSTADGSYVTYTLKLRNEVMAIKDIGTNKIKEYPIFVSPYGIAYNSTYISPKKLNTVVSSYVDKNSFKFDSIIPGLTILNDNGDSTISEFIDHASVKMSLYGVEGKLKDDKVYVELYKLESVEDTTGSKIDDYVYNISDLTSRVTFDDLFPDTNYYFRVYGYAMSGGEYKKEYLYDINQQKTGVPYYFKTVSNVGISNIRVKYYAESYRNRKLKIRYNLERVYGYTYIRYNVYRKYVDLEGEIHYDLLDEVVTSDDFVFKNAMEKNIYISNESGFVTGQTYVVEIQPVLTVNSDSTTYDVLLESARKVYTFNNLYKPYFSINQSNTSSSITYRVNISDYNKVIVDGLYKVQILNSNGVDVTPEEYASKTFSISLYNKIFVLNGTAPNTQYTFRILYDEDRHNDVNLIQSCIYSLNSSTSGSASEVSLGNVYATTDKSDSTKINLSFFDSRKLTNATILRYSIYDDNSFSIDDEVEFKPVPVGTGDSLYYMFQIPETISANGIYHVSMQFLDDDGNILAEDTVEYRFL